MCDVCFQKMKFFLILMNLVLKFEIVGLYIYNVVDSPKNAFETSKIILSI